MATASAPVPAPGGGRSGRAGRWLSTRLSGENASSQTHHVDIVGAGPAGLAAAITAARAGLDALVRESADRVGSRFHGDFQGLENWTTDEDVLVELQRLGIEPTFEHAAVRNVTVFGPDGTEHHVGSEAPLFYLVRRGSGAGTLDRALLAQARQTGATVRFGEPVQRLPRGGIVAHGPRGANIIAVGWTFRTDLAWGAYAALGEAVAPGGYAYLLAWEGAATLAVCLFADFHREDLYLGRALDLFRERLAFSMVEPRRFGGAGVFRLAESAVRQAQLVAGEAAGFQDPFWGFGMRFALLSGLLAARAWLAGTPAAYDRLWRERLQGLMRTGIVNRALHQLFGDRSSRCLALALSRTSDPRAWLRKRYSPSWIKTLVFPLARRIISRPARAAACFDAGCSCTWCRCARGA